MVSKLGQSNLDNHQFLFWSSLVSFLTFFLIILIQKQLKVLATLSAKDWTHAIVLGLLGTYLYYILLYFGYAHAKGIEVLIIQYCWPIFVIVLSILILKESLMVVLSDFKLPTRETYVPIVVNGIFVNGLSYLLWIAALKIGKASFIASFIFLTPVISTVLLILLFDEPFQWVYVVGMASVIVGGLINKE